MLSIETTMQVLYNTLNKIGQVNSSFFQPIASLASSRVGDPYIDPARRVLLS